MRPTKIQTGVGPVEISIRDPGPFKNMVKYLLINFVAHGPAYCNGVEASRSMEARQPIVSSQQLGRGPGLDAKKGQRASRGVEPEAVVFGNSILWSAFLSVEDFVTSEQSI